MPTCNLNAVRALFRQADVCLRLWQDWKKDLLSKSSHRANKQQFDRDLRQFLAQHSQAFSGQWTPFWATGRNGHGHPLEAKLVIIGFNPSSGVNAPWFNFWHPHTGFNMVRFQQARSIAVQLHNQLPGSKKKRATSKTRAKIQRLAAETMRPDATYVNTNVYWAVSSRARLLTNKYPAPLLWLLQRVPSDAVIVVHGVHVKNVYATLRNANPHLPDAIRAARHLAVISDLDFTTLKAQIKIGLKDNRVKRVSALHKHISKFRGMAINVRNMKLAYVRVSTNDRDAASQVSALKSAGCEKIFREELPGGGRNRPELHRLLDQLRKGDVPVVGCLDRFSRSLRDVLVIMERIQKSKAGFVSLSESIDTTTAAGRIMMQMFAALAEFERAVHGP